ncbi:MAG: 3-keto-5-aminohexanoate cleavage protein [Armatimonadetes bacterium]|nr:3-keto-5-aminohexanoate cleavage protein [Armatimonadota bacterium]
MNDKVIVTAAITGSIHTPTMTPYLPITPREIADEAVRAHEEGAAVVHIHVRVPGTGEPTYAVDLYREVVTDIKRRCDVVVCITSGGFSPDTSERTAAIRTFRPELGSFNAGSMNFGLFHVVPRYAEWKFAWESEFLQGTEDLVFANSFMRLREFCAAFGEAETKPEIEIYDLGMINNVTHLVQGGHLAAPVYLQFVLGILGGAPATLETLSYLVRTAESAFDCLEWSVCSAGRSEFPLCTLALLLGGNVRVGLEDNLYLQKGVMAKSNGELVAKIVRIARELGREPASPDEARRILGLKGLDSVAY